MVQNDQRLRLWWGIYNVFFVFLGEDATEKCEAYNIRKNIYINSSVNVFFF